MFREFWILEIYLKSTEMYKIVNSPVFFEYLMVRACDICATRKIV